MGLSGRHIRMVPLAVIPPPIITPRDTAVGFAMTVAPMRAVNQIIIPTTQNPIPMRIFNSNLPSE
jgi:hypothetical protein